MQLLDFEKFNQNLHERSFSSDLAFAFQELKSGWGGRRRKVIFKYHWLNLWGKHTLLEAPSGARQELIASFLAALEDKFVFRSAALKVKVLVTQSCQTLCYSVVCSLLGSSVLLRQYWSRWLFPSPGDLPNPGIEPGSPAGQAYSLPPEPRALNKCAIMRALTLSSHRGDALEFRNQQIDTLTLRLPASPVLISNFEQGWRIKDRPRDPAFSERKL